MKIAKKKKKKTYYLHQFCLVNTSLTIDLILKFNDVFERL